MFSLVGFAGEGVVVTLEAPLFSQPEADARIVQRLRQGDVIVLHLRHDRSGRGAAATSEMLPPQASHSLGDGFYQTTDRNGRRAYVMSRHIKLITQDQREQMQPMASFKPDITDYRIPEPLPQGYPLRQKIGRYRGQISLGPGSYEIQTYSYRHAPQGATSYPKIQLLLQETRQLFVDDVTSRLHIGGLFQWVHGRSRAHFSNGYQAKETSTRLTLGPILAYDLWRSDGYRLVFSGGLGVDLINRYLVIIDDESHRFEGITLTPIFSLQLHQKNVWKNVDLVLGSTFNLLAFQQLRTQAPQLDGPFWGNQKVFKRDFLLDLALLAGLQYTY